MMDYAQAGNVGFAAVSSGLFAFSVCQMWQMLRDGAFGVRNRLTGTITVVSRNRDPLRYWAGATLVAVCVVLTGFFAEHFLWLALASKAFPSGAEAREVLPLK